MSDLPEEPFLEPGTFVLMGTDLLLDSVNFALREDAPLEWLEILAVMRNSCEAFKAKLEELVGHPWDVVPYDAHAIQSEMVSAMYEFKAQVDNIRRVQGHREDLELLKSQVAEVMLTISRIQGRNQGDDGSWYRDRKPGEDG